MPINPLDGARPRGTFNPLAASQATARPRNPTEGIANGTSSTHATYGARPTFVANGPKRDLENGALANTTLTGNPNGAPYGDPARGRLESDTAAGYANADKYGIGAEGSMGRLNDDRKAEIDALLAKQQAGLDGMTPAEMQAAKEQGNSTINQQLATNMSQFGDLAAGNGVRGGSAMGLQMQALQQAQGQSGELARKMILDNMAQKNIAMDRYGNTLQTQQGVGLGIQDSNNQSSNAEKLARELAAGNYTSQLDSYRAGDKSDDFTQQALNLTKDQIDAFKTTGGYNGGKGAANGGSGEGFNAIDAADTHKVNELDKLTKDAKARLGTAFDLTDQISAPGPGIPGLPGSGGTPGLYKPRDPGKDLADLNAAKRSIEELIRTQFPGESEENQQKMIDDEFAKVQEDANGGKNSCIITTEAMRQGLLDERWREVTREYKLRKMKREDIQVYWAWAQSIVERMQARPLFARAVAAVLPGTLAAMAKEMNLRESAPLHGRFFFGVYKALNAAFRPIVLKRNGEPMAPKAVERMFRIRAA